MFSVSLIWGQDGFPHHLGISIFLKPDEVLIEEDLQNFLLTKFVPQEFRKALPTTRK